MWPVILPVLLSLFLGPGMGQIYNKEYKKAAALIAITLGVVLAGFVWYRKQLMPLLPGDLTTIDPSALQEIVRQANQTIYSGHGMVLNAFAALLLTLQIFGVVDAYRVAMRKRGND